MVVLTDLDYADDICLVSKEVDRAQELLNRVETECAKVGQGLNAKKDGVHCIQYPRRAPTYKDCRGHCFDGGE